MIHAMRCDDDPRLSQAQARVAEVATFGWLVTIRWVQGKYGIQYGKFIYKDSRRGGHLCWAWKGCVLGLVLEVLITIVLPDVVSWGIPWSSLCISPRHHSV